MDDRAPLAAHADTVGQTSTERLPEPALLRPNAACKRLGCSRSTLYRLVREHRLAAVKPFGAGELRFRLADLRAFVDGLEPVNKSMAMPSNDDR
jgi:excisionase family DNA binding protein